MNWYIDFSENSLKFLKKNNLKEDLIIEKIKLVLRKFKGENIKKMGSTLFLNKYGDSYF